MKKLALACCLFAVTAFAQAAKPAEPAKPAAAAAAKPAEAAKPVVAEAAKPADAAPAAPGFKPRHVTKGGDKKGIEAMYKEFDEAMKKGDLEACIARVDFPVMMMTDNAAGVPMTAMWDKATWTESMKKSMADMPKDMKMAKKTKITFMTDSLAFVEETNDMTMGKLKDKWTSGAIVTLKDGKWMVKGMIEGGWGDVMPAAAVAEPVKAAAPAAKEPAKAVVPAKAGEPAKK